MTHHVLAGRPNWHRTSDVQSSSWARPPRVLHQPTAGRSGVFVALHKHGGGKATFTLSVSSASRLCPHTVSFHSQRNCRSGSNPSEAFRFLTEDRIVCQQSLKAKYTQRVEYIIQLPVPMDQATNTGEALMGCTVCPTHSPILHLSSGAASAGAGLV